MILSELQTEVFAYNGKAFEYFSKNATTTVAQDATQEYSNSSSYSWGEYVKISAIKRKFRCANISGVSGHDPVGYLGRDWVDSGAINESAMFDSTVSSQTESDADFTVSMNFNGANTLTLQNLENIATVRVVQRSSDSSIIYYDETISSRSIGRTSYYDYYTRPLDTLQKLSITKGLRSVGTSILDIYFTINVGYIGKVGLVAIGRKHDVGLTLYGTSLGYDDYSVYKTDEFGFTNFEKRSAIDVVDGSVLIATDKIDSAVDLFKKVRGKLSHYIGDDRESGRLKSLDLIGYVKTIRITVDNPKLNKYPIQIIGGA